MPHKTRTSDVNHVFLLLCVGATFFIPNCKATCDIQDAQRCLSNIGSNNVDTFRCNEGDKTCINGLKNTCAGSRTSRSISRLSDVVDYLCTTMGESDLNAYLNCFQTLGASQDGLAKLGKFTDRVQMCANDLSRISTSSSLSDICDASKAFKSCMVAAVNGVCQEPAARRFFAKFADLVDITGCFSGVAANIPFISMLSMVVWAGILGFFLTLS